MFWLACGLSCERNGAGYERAMCALHPVAARTSHATTVAIMYLIVSKSKRFLFECLFLRVLLKKVDFDKSFRKGLVFLLGWMLERRRYQLSISKFYRRIFEIVLICSREFHCVNKILHYLREKQGRAMTLQRKPRVIYVALMTVIKNNNNFVKSPLSSSDKGSSLD